MYDYFGSMRKASLALKVSVASISRWCAQPIPTSCRRRCCTKTSDALVALISMYLKENPGSSCPTIVRQIKETLGCSVSRQLVHVIVRKRLGLTFKRTRKRGCSSKRFDRPAFFSAFLDAHARGRLVAIDESGFDQRCTPVYGYAPKGQPAIVNWKTCSDRKRYNLVMAIHGTSGASHRVITANPVNGTTFSQFILGLPFGNGTVVLLDNAAIHKTALVRAAAMVKGFTLLFMPPYSPEFNPIELVFGVIKKAFYAARYDHGPTYDLLRTVESASLHHSNARTIVGCFRHVNGIIRQAWHDYGV